MKEEMLIGNFKHLKYITVKFIVFLHPNLQERRPLLYTHIVLLQRVGLYGVDR